MFFRPLLWPTVLTLLALCVLIGLGTWQLQRLQWKEGLIATVEARLAQPPAPLPPAETWPDLDVDAMEFTRLTATGVFRHDLERHLFVAQPGGEPGFLVITPLRLEGGGHVLVTRGFVPQALKDPASRPEGQVSGVQRIEGVVRAPGEKAGFAPETDIEGNIWYWRDLDGMARSVGLAGVGAPVAPFFIEASPSSVPGGWPEARPERPNIVNNHLQYALTWYALAIVLVGVYIAYHWREGRIGRGR